MFPQLREDDAAHQEDSREAVGCSEVHRKPHAHLAQEIRHPSMGAGDRLEPADNLDIQGVLCEILTH